MAMKVSAPAYVLAEKKDREELLSQWGISSTSQRALFHELCASWSPVLEYNTFIAPRVLTHKSLVSDIEVLFSKLRDCRVGILITKKDPAGHRVSERILLTDEGSPLFWNCYLSEAVRASADNPKNPFLTESYLKSRGMELDTTSFVTLSSKDLVKSYIEENAQNLKVAVLVFGEDRVFCPLGDLTLLVSLASAKIRLALKNTDALTAVARIMNSNLTELNKKLESKEILFWKGLTFAVLSNREELHRDMKASFDKGFFLATHIFHSYMENMIEEQQKLRDMARERELDMKQIEQFVLQKEDAFVEPKELNMHMKSFEDKYKEGFHQFKEDFFLEYAQSSQKTGLPNIVELDYGWVHRTKLYIEIHARWQVTMTRVKEEFSSRMDLLLRTGNKGEDVSFFSSVNLENALWDYLSSQDPVLVETFKKPRLLAEAVIVYGKGQQGLKSIDDMKGLMAPFFKEGTMTLKELRVIFQINVSQLFERSMKNMSLWRQLILRISGRYKSLRELLSNPNHSEMNKASPSTKGNSGFSGLSSYGSSKTSGASVVKTSGSSSGKKVIGYATAGKKKKVEEPKGPTSRYYSENETNSAWEQFGKNLKKP